MVTAEAEAEAAAAGPRQRACAPRAAPMTSGVRCGDWGGGGG